MSRKPAPKAKPDPHPLPQSGGSYAIEAGALIPDAKGKAVQNAAPATPPLKEV